MKKKETNLYLIVIVLFILGVITIVLLNQALKIEDFININNYKFIVLPCWFIIVLLVLGAPISLYLYIEYRFKKNFLGYLKLLFLLIANIICAVFLVILLNNLINFQIKTSSTVCGVDFSNGRRRSPDSWYIIAKDNSGEKVKIEVTQQIYNQFNTYSNCENINKVIYYETLFNYMIDIQ